MVSFSIILRLIFLLEEFSDLYTKGIFPYHIALVLSIFIVMHNIDNLLNHHVLSDPQYCVIHANITMIIVY